MVIHVYRFVNKSDFASSVKPRVVEGEPAQPLRVRLRHNLQALHDPLHVLMLQHRIFAYKKIMPKSRLRLGLIHTRHNIAIKS